MHRGDTAIGAMRKHNRAELVVHLPGGQGRAGMLSYARLIEQLACFVASFLALIED